MRKIPFIDEYFEEMKGFQEHILDFIEKDDSDNSYLEQYLQESCIREDKYKIKEVFHIIARISEQHHRNINFFQKIEHIIKFFSYQMKTFSNLEIFNLFKRNKRVLLFLFEENILEPTEEIFYIINEDKYKRMFYLQYFYSEFEKFFRENERLKIEKDISFNSNLESFKKLRKIGENETSICSLIRNDSVIDFITFVNKNNVSLESTIKTSIYETNNFLLKNDPSLIEYAAFFGSIQIFNYLFQNKVKVESNLFLYAVHSQNSELFKSMIEKNPNPEIEYDDLFYESIKCHHNDFAKYFYDSFFNINNNKYWINYTKCLNKYNFLFTLNSFKDINDWCFFFCKFSFYTIVNYLLQNQLVDINDYQILNRIFF